MLVRRCLRLPFTCQRERCATKHLVVRDCRTKTPRETTRLLPKGLVPDLLCRVFERNNPAELLQLPDVTQLLDTCVSNSERAWMAVSWRGRSGLHCLPAHAAQSCVVPLDPSKSGENIKRVQKTYILNWLDRKRAKRARDGSVP